MTTAGMQEVVFFGIVSVTVAVSGTISDPQQGQDVQFVLVTNQTFPYNLESLSDAEGVITKRWQIKFYVWSKIDNELQRKRLFISQKIKARSARYVPPDKLIPKSNRLLKTRYVVGKKVGQKKNRLFISALFKRT